MNDFVAMWEGEFHFPHRNIQCGGFRSSVPSLDARRRSAPFLHGREEMDVSEEVVWYKIEIFCDVIHWKYVKNKYVLTDGPSTSQSHLTLAAIVPLNQ